MDIERAKKLIKTGMMLQDDELIKMGEEMLAGLENTDIEENVIEKKVYHCSSCNTDFPKDKERKRCINCKKQALSIVGESTEEKERPKKQETPQDGISSIFKPGARIGDNPEARAIYDESGKKIGTAGRKVAVTLGKNKFVDLRDTPDDLDPVQKKINQQISMVSTPITSHRPKTKLVKTQCSSCNKTFDINPAFYVENWKCDACILKRREGYAR